MFINMYNVKENLLTINIFVILITIIINSPPVFCKNDVIKWNECTEVLLQLRNCTDKLHLPKHCDNIQKTELLQCAEAIVNQKHSCKDPLAIKIMNNFVSVFQKSDKVLCQKNLNSKFAQDEKCTAIAQKIAVGTGTITPNSLSEKGCRALKSRMYTHALSINKHECFELIREYVDALYDETSCSKYKVESPTLEELKHIKKVYVELVSCWMTYQDMPSCNSDVTTRMKCLNKVDITSINKEFHALAHNFIEVSKKTDKAICNNEQLKKDFNNHADCWDFVKSVGLMILGQANGFLTSEGCRTVKYRENITMAYFHQHCAKLLLDYRQEMDKLLPCDPQPADDPAPHTNPPPVYHKDGVIEWNECTEVLSQIRNCVKKLHLPKHCDNIEKTQLLQCAEDIVNQQHSCKDPLAIKIMNNCVSIFQKSDKVLCQKNLYSKFAQDESCTDVAREIAIGTGTLTPDSLSEKGCRALKSGMYTHAFAVNKRECFELIREYVDALYDETACGKIKVESPTLEELKHINGVSIKLVACWMVNEEMSSCKSDVSKRMECLKQVNITSINKNFHALANNFVEVSRETDKAICKNEKLKKDFVNHGDCWEYVKTVGLMILGQANGFLTSEGCKIVKYRENITMANFDQHCAQMLLDYRAEMDKLLPCDPQSAAGSASFLQPKSLMLVYLVSLILIIKLCILDK